MSDNTPPNDPHDLDLIQMVQRARMANDAQARPSEVKAVYWIEAKSPTGAPTPRAGAWIIPTTVGEVDALWERVKSATEAGKLGYKAKVSTAPSKGQGRTSDRVIHIRVADSDDQTAVERVRQALVDLGIDAALTYSRDKAED